MSLDCRYTSDVLKNFNNYSFLAGSMLSNALITSKKLKHTSSTPVMVIVALFKETEIIVTIDCNGFSIK